MTACRINVDGGVHKSLVNKNNRSIIKTCINGV